MPLTRGTLSGQIGGSKALPTEHNRSDRRSQNLINFRAAIAA